MVSAQVQSPTLIIQLQISSIDLYSLFDHIEGIELGSNFELSPLFLQKGTAAWLPYQSCNSLRRYLDAISMYEVESVFLYQKIQE